MKDLENNKLEPDSNTGCISVELLIDHAFTPDTKLEKHLGKCSTCQMILEGIRYEIETAKQENREISSEILKLQEQRKENELINLINKDDFYSRLSDAAGLSISTEKMIRKDLESGINPGHSMITDKTKHASGLNIFSLHTLTGKIAAGISVALITATALLLILKDTANGRISSAPAEAVYENNGERPSGEYDTNYDRYELRVPVNNIKTQKDLIDEIRDPSRKMHALEQVLNEKAVAERLKSSQMNPFLLRVTDLTDDSVLFQQAVSHPPRELYNTKLKGEWKDSTRFRIDYYLIRNMELIDSLKKED